MTSFKNNIEFYIKYNLYEPIEELFKKDEKEFFNKLKNIKDENFNLNLFFKKYNKIFFKNCKTIFEKMILIKTKYEDYIEKNNNLKYNSDFWFMCLNIEIKDCVKSIETKKDIEILKYFIDDINKFNKIIELHFIYNYLKNFSEIIPFKLLKEKIISFGYDLDLKEYFSEFNGNMDYLILIDKKDNIKINI